MSDDSSVIVLALEETSELSQSIFESEVVKNK